MSIPSNWFETFFHGVTLDLWRRAISLEQTTAEAQFLIENLNCEKGAHVLDVPCGNGRLSFEMAKRGLRVTGIDISREFIEEARAIQNGGVGPPTTAGGSDITFILGDMRYVEAVTTYDGAYCFGNSFAFFDHSNMQLFLSAIARGLKPGARFLIETGMAAESVLPDFEEQSCHEMGDMIITMKEQYVAVESCIDSEYIFEREGKTETRRAREWIYTVAEIRRMLEHAGFAILNVYGSLKGEPYKLGDQELFIVTSKR